MSNQSEKRVMVIPGAKAQIPLIDALHKSGFKVLCVNPYKNSPAFEFSDYSECYDILDVDSCTEAARRYGVCAVMSDECDIAMPPLAAISERLGLNSIGSDMARLYTNKRAMRDFSVKNGFAAPKYRQCETVGEAREFFKTLKRQKMIIKPLDSNSSRGVYTVTESAQLSELFEKSIAFSKVSKAVLCEEYIEGTEFTLDGIMLAGRHFTLAVSEKKHYPHHPNIASELYFSHKNSAFDYDELRRINDSYVEKSGLPFGFTHAEYKYDGDRFVLIEIGARGGGNFISSHIVPAMTGIDNYALLIGATMGENCSKDLTVKDEYAQRCCILKFFDIPPENNGKILREIEGESVLSSSPEVLLYGFNAKAGECVSFADDDSKRIGFYIAYGDTKKELDAFVDTVDNEVRFIF